MPSAQKVTQGIFRKRSVAKSYTFLAGFILCKLNFNNEVNQIDD